MRHLVWALIVTCQFGFGSSGFSQQVDPRSTFLLFDVNTPLQKALLGEVTTVYAVINGDDLIKDGSIQPSNLDVTALSDQFRNRQIRLEGGVVLLNVRVTSTNLRHKSAQEFIGLAAKGIAVEAGIAAKKVQLGSSFEIQAWEEKINAANQHLTGIPPGQEAAVIDDSSLIFSIQTILSSWLTDNADCIVFIKGRAKHADSEVIPFTVRQAVERSLDNLKLPQRKRIIFSVESEGDGRSAVDRFVENEQHQEVAKSLGFESGAIRHTAFK